MLTNKLFGVKKLNFKQRTTLVKKSCILDETWYIQHYQDVDIDAALHFAIHGLAEGRMADERHLSLWSADESTGLVAELHKQVLTKNQVVMPYTAWLLGRWYASRNRWQEAFEVISILVSKQGMLNVTVPVFLLWIDALRKTNKCKKARKYLSKRILKDQSTDLVLSKANLVKGLCGKEDVFLSSEWFKTVNEVYSAHSFNELVFANDNAELSIDNIRCSKDFIGGDSENEKLVSIIIPLFNAAEIITTTIQSLLEQTWRNIEVIVVDDASTDNSVLVVKELAKSDLRIKLIELEQNSGAYYCRNLGVSIAKGEYITVHDADDWSHSQKIEAQVKPLEKHFNLMATFSSWVRVSSVMEFGSWQTPSGWNGWVHRNTSSLMVRKQVVTDIGYWDNVVCNADTEYVHRVIKFYGDDAIKDVYRDIPLSFGRFHSGSLTQIGATNIFTIFSGLRKDYTNAYINWHDSITDKSELYVALDSTERPFLVPCGMIRKK